MTGAIFCGGKSSRMGQPKEVMVLRSGVTLIEHVYQILSVLCSKIVLLGNPSKIPASLEKLDRIPDNFSDIGPIAGLEAMLSSGIDDEYLTVPCDLDRINVDALKILIDAKGKLPIILRRKDQLEPLIGRYSPDILPVIREKIKRNLFSLKAVLFDIEHTEILVLEALNLALNNVNTIHDFK
ncbi:MAG: molybdenum cofactor guanylyltransferase [Candidatus Omnitrophica bacterium]|nr:molybdenum cofactor guanylyltransferase [Candidatus Omnitrophota bacterium]